MQQLSLSNVYILNRNKNRDKNKNKIKVNILNKSFVIGLYKHQEKNNLTIILISLQSPFGDFNDQV
jgi:hypothetical protein